ncbi:MAG: sulfatase-like hydrolase/transferase [Myxococcota bacterium]
MRRMAAVLLWVAAGAGCGSASGSAPGSEPARAAASSREATERAGADGRAAPDDPAPMRAWYDLARHPERAEPREGRTRIVRPGTPGGAKHTLGSWRTGLSPATIADRPVALVTGRRGRIWLPWDQEGDAALTLRARALAPGPVALRIGGKELGRGDWPRGDFGILRFRIPADRLRRGDNALQIRTLRVGRAPDGTRASVAIDWIRLGPIAEGHREDAPEPATQGRTDAGLPVLHLPPGRSLTWTFRVPRGARLRGVARGGAPVAIAHTDTGPSRRLATGGHGALDVDLSDLEGQWVGLEVGAPADGEGLALIRPAIVVPERSRQPGEHPRARNVLVYVVDTLRADKLSPYDPQTRVETPGLSRFVETAATFLHARAQENWTKPSIATLLSSLMPWEHTATRGSSVVPRSVALLPEMLREHGFHTGAFIANGYVSGKFGFERGWDDYRNYIRESRRTDAEFVAADALDWLDRRPEDRPFFLYVHTIDPHVPYRPPEEELARYGDPHYRGPVSFRRDATLLEKIKTGKLRLRPRDKRQLEALYDGEISYHDVHFAAILDGLERRGLADDTLVIVTSDHGEEFWDHGSVGHGHSVYDELLRVPFFVRLPGVARGARVRADVGLVDVVPTVLDALRLPIPEHASGRSLLPLLEGDAPASPSGTVSGFLDNWRALTVDGLKLVHRGAGEARLYDLREDPGETRDVLEGHPVAERHARAMLGLALAGTEPVTGAARRARPRPKPAHREQTVEIDEETEAQLRALGYVE